MEGSPGEATSGAEESDVMREESDVTLRKKESDVTRENSRNIPHDFTH